uniref:Transposon Ty3-G Gag-Pol polyprotein n=1 Tax=Tanacetum cinerariifolium TaxID=118510 RepID=A0A699H110_TANCI|nr:transposon Ty3-G Gag-Pol polyprotein [Tanacetum cinerariifolium]
MAQLIIVKKVSGAILMALAAAATVSAQKFAPAPAPLPEIGAAFSVPASGVIVMEKIAPNIPLNFYPFSSFLLKSDPNHIGIRAVLISMETRKKTTEQFQQETQETLAKFAAMFEKIIGDYQNLQTTVHTIQQKNPGHPSSSGGGPDAALLRRFDPTDFEDPSEALSRLTQAFTVATYVEAFERLSHRVDGLPEVFLLGCFIGGLKDEIRLEVKIKKPRNLSDAIGIARLVENKLTLQRTPSSLPRIVGSTAPPKPPTSAGLLVQAQPQNAPVAMDEPDETVVEDSPAEISFHAITGAPMPQTLRLPGQIKNKDVVVLVDGGNTHNFIDQALVDRFGLTVEKDTPFKVVVANREHVSCAGRVGGLTITIQGYLISTDFFVLPVAACPVVLGVQWLKTLGPVETDYEKLTLGFHLAGSSHKLQGLKSSELAALKSHEAMVLHGPAPLLYVSLLPSEPTSDISPCTAIRDVLERFAKPYLQKTEIERQVCELLQQGLICPSHSPFSSPVLLVKKADGSWRFCIDYRSLNDITVKDKYPIPVIDELLDELHGSRIYSKLDLRSEYHQIRVQDEDIHKTAFRTHDGHYEFVVMPFGLTNAPTTFQCLMNDLFRPFLRKFILVFFDDILVYSKTIDDHVEHLTVVLGILESNHLFAKQSKCCFGVSQVHYLGHLISVDGVAVEPNKVQSVLSWPTPKNAKGVRGFLGLAGYYRKFIQGFRSIAAPLHKLVGNGSFVWDEVAEAAFQTLKIALTTTPTLGLPDWSQPFTVECDASGVGIGAVLTQRGKPLAYFSAPLKGSMLSWSTYEKEMLAVVKAKGVSNRGADALSRIPEFHFMAISHPCASIWQDIQNEVRTDPYYQTLLTGSDHEGRHELVMRDGIWFRDGAILLCPTSPLLETVLALCHASPEGGHFGFHKTLYKVKQTFCMLPTGLLQSLPILERVWEDISMDFVEGLPNSKGFTVVMVVVDRLSKYAHFIPLKHPFTAVSVAKEFVLNVVKLHGIPATVVSDRDKVFISSFWQVLFKLQGSHLCMSSSYHPQTEVINRIMEQYLRCFAGDQPKKWLDWLPWAEYSYNTSVHSSTKLSPFQVVYGRPPPRLVPYVPSTTKVQAVDEYLGYRDALLRQLRANLIVAQNRMKVQADRKRHEVEFLEGDLVFVKLQPYRQVTVAHRTSHKLAPKFFGPYKILKRVGQVVPTAPVFLDDTVFTPLMPQPECVLDERVIKKRKYRPRTEVPIKWVGKGREDATWETKWRFAKAFPDFHPDDKVGSSGVDCYGSNSFQETAQEDLKTHEPMHACCVF